MTKIRGLVSVLVIMVVAVLLAGYSEVQPTTEDRLKETQREKTSQAADLMETMPVPHLTYSIERENIAKRLTITNNPSQIGWIYLFETGRVIGRFPVRGKVTSGSKRLTSTDMFMKGDNQGYICDYVVEAPDEMGAYGPSGDYIFWFDPEGNYHQFKGNYFYSTKPYQIRMGTISVEIDQEELARYKEAK